MVTRIQVTGKLGDLRSQLWNRERRLIAARRIVHD
jgi:hypothetical protein